MFYLSNPIFIAFAVWTVSDLRKKRMAPPMAAAAVGLIVNLLCLCMHKTFGGYQFGARYVIDLVPFALFYLLLSHRRAPMRWELGLCAFGLMINAYGAMAVRL